MYNKITEEETFEALQLRVKIDKFGTKRYYNHDNELHRKYGPAIVYTDSNKYWYLNGKYHRVDGPAGERANGDKYWYINGERLTEAEFLKHPLCTIK